MRKMKLLIVLLLAYSGMKAQNTALQFDGVDDFAFVTINQPNTTIDAESYTFEAIFKATATGQNMVLLSVPQASGDLLFGLDANGTPYLQHRDDMYLVEEPQNLNHEECHHMAITVFDVKVKFYVDGNYVGHVPLNGVPPFTNQTNWYLGMDFKKQSSFFNGTVDEIRIWSEAISDAEISTWAFITPFGVGATNRYILLPFYEGIGNHSIDPLAGALNYAFWNGEGSGPHWTEPCIIEQNLSFKVGPNPPPVCVPININNLICNGDFEQFDPILLTPTGIAASPSDAFQPDPNGLTDVSNWFHINSSPDMYVRNGIGNIPSLIWNGSPNTWNFPTTGNNAMIGLFNGNGIGTFGENEGLMTKLTTPLIQGNYYEFSAYVYNKNLLGDLTFNNLKVTPRSSSLGINLTTLPSQPTPLHNTVSGNNGWHYISFTFMVPFGPWGNTLDELIINADLFSSGTRTLCYTYYDDLSLEPVVCPSNFPQSISLTPNTGTLPAGTYIDYNGNNYNVPVAEAFSVLNHHHGLRLVETDFNGNSYVAAYVNFAQNANWVSQFNPTLTYSSPTPITRQLDGWSGILLSKYNDCGELQWQHIIYNRSHTALAGLAVSPNGDVYVLGLAESNGSAGQILTTTSPGSLSQAPFAGRRIFIAGFNTNGVNSFFNSLIVSSSKYAVDFELLGTKKLVTINDGGDFEVLDFNVSPPSQELFIAGRNALKTTMHGNVLYIAEAEDLTTTPFISIRNYNTSTFPFSNVNSSLPIIDDVFGGRSSFGFPYQTISDILCDNNGNLFVTGNFSNGLSFVGGTPAANVSTSVYQNYHRQGIGISGFVASYTPNLVYSTSDYIKPPTIPATMIQISTVNSVTYQCTPPNPGDCDIVTTTTSNYCTGNTYLCIDVTTSWVNTGEAYASLSFYSSLFHNLSIDANNNVLISGIVNDAVWSTNQQISTNAQVYVCKYTNTLDRVWFNETQGDFGIENQLSGTTAIAYNPSDGQHRVVGNFIGTTKLFDNTTITTTGNHEHIFVTKLEDWGITSVFKDEPIVAEENLLRFKAYPNPAQNVLHIIGNEAGFEFTMQNSLGQVVLNGRAQNSFEELSLDNLSNGLYVLHVSGEASEFFKIVITK